MALVAMTLTASACTSSARPTTSPTTAATLSPTTTALDQGVFGALPSGCDATPVAAATAPLAFAVQGRVWAVDPAATTAGSSARCLFATEDAGLFSWGPRGDRVVLRGMEVRPIGAAPSRPKGSVQVSYFSWSRPTGTTVVFVDPAQAKLERADMGTSSVRDITPIPGLKYGDLAYHPSGLSIGFVAASANETGLWMATNQGTQPVNLVHAGSDTHFNHIVFAHDGVGLFYSVDQGDHHSLARYDLTTGRSAEALWTGSAPIADILETAGQPGAGLTAGADCAHHQAVYSALDGQAGTPLGSQMPGPTSVVSRVDADRFVIASGGCGGPSDLYVVSRSNGSATLLIRGVDAAGSRAPEPTPPPPLPPALPAAGFA